MVREEQRCFTAWTWTFAGCGSCFDCRPHLVRGDTPMRTAIGCLCITLVTFPTRDYDTASFLFALCNEPKSLASVLCAAAEIGATRLRNTPGLHVQ